MLLLHGAQVLKQKKLYESQREQLYSQQFNMEQTRFTIDSIKDTVGTVQAMKSANTEMRGMMKKNKELDIGYIEKMQDEMFDMMDMASEINEVMGRCACSGSSARGGGGGEG